MPKPCVEKYNAVGLPVTVTAPLSGRAAHALPNLPQIFGKASEATMSKALSPYHTRTTQNAKRLKQRAIGIKR